MDEEVNHVSSNRPVTKILLMSALALFLATTLEARERKPGTHQDKDRKRTEAKRSTERSMPERDASSKQLDRQTDTPRVTDTDQAERKDAGARQQMSADQQANVQQLRADLETLADGGRAAEDEIRELAEDLQSMAISAPDPQLIEQLATDLAAATANGSLSPQEMLALSQSVEAVLASAGVSQSEMAVLIDDVEAILSAAGVGRAEVQAVVRDLEAIAASASSGSRARSPENAPSSRARRGRSSG